MTYGLEFVLTLGDINNSIGRLRLRLSYGVDCCCGTSPKSCCLRTIASSQPSENTCDRVHVSVQGSIETGRINYYKIIMQRPRSRKSNASSSSPQHDALGIILAMSHHLIRAK